jgi:hypothetical protein
LVAASAGEEPVAARHHPGEAEDRGHAEQSKVCAWGPFRWGASVALPPRA